MWFIESWQFMFDEELHNALATSMSSSTEEEDKTAMGVDE
jgi:hypothetical protein